MSLGESKSIFYFNSEGKQNLETTVALSIKRAKEIGISNIIVFTANGEGAFLTRQALVNDKSITVHAATFPYQQVFYNKDADGKEHRFTAATSDPSIRKQFKKEKINLIQGVMPLQDIIIPGAKDTKIQSINHTLGLFSGGLRLCIQAVLMAADGGHIEPGNQVIAMSADTSIVARSSLSSLIFHPSQGFEINEIICKPNCFSISRNNEK